MKVGETPVVFSEADHFKLCGLISSNTESYCTQLRTIINLNFELGKLMLILALLLGIKKLTSKRKNRWLKIQKIFQNLNM